MPFTRDEVVAVARSWAHRCGVDATKWSDEKVCRLTGFALPPLRANGAQPAAPQRATLDRHKTSAGDGG